jgi:hypothetical protein
MQTIKNFFYWIINWRQRRQLAKRIDELRKRDPFIYK